VKHLAVAALVMSTACAPGQDPGLPTTTGAGPTTTSHTLAPCPAGGPDATTPAAGCLDPDGIVLRP